MQFRYFNISFSANTNYNHFMKKVLVTGGLGFFGQYLCAALLRDHPEAEIRIAARRQRPVFHPDLAAAFASSRVKVYYETDLLNQDSLQEAFQGVDTVFHCAAMVSFWRRDRTSLMEQNVQGTQNIIELCRQHKVALLIHVSSTAALGYTGLADRPGDENLRFDWSRAGKYVYALSKYRSEQVVHQAVAGGLPARIANICSIYGPGDEKTLPLLGSIQNQKLPAMMPGGLACIDVRDAADGLLAIARKGENGEQYILAGGNYSHRELITTIADALKVNPPAHTFSPLAGRLLMPIISLMETVSRRPPKITSEVFDMGFTFRYFNTAKARSQLAWHPRYSLQQTFEDMAAEYLATPNRDQKQEQTQ